MLKYYEVFVVWVLFGRSILTRKWKGDFIRIGVSLKRKFLLSILRSSKLRMGKGKYMFS